MGKLYKNGTIAWIVSPRLPGSLSFFPSGEIERTTGVYLIDVEDEWRINEDASASSRRRFQPSLNSIRLLLLTSL